MGTPKDYEYALLCDGSEISASDYGDLVAMIGNRLPNLTDGRFLEGSTTAGEYKSAGLPNITGGLIQNAYGYGVSLISVTQQGALYYSSNGGSNMPSSGGSNGYSLHFDASLSNSIYGNSTTVQPQSMTVKYYICYA